MNRNIPENIEKKIQKHPCYNSNAHDYARMHIPVAPRCNIQCNYCNRKYDCMNESRPGVTSGVLTPKQALEKYIYVKNEVKNLSVVGIAGPGDALENMDEVKMSVKMIKEQDSDVIICLSTNGLRLAEFADELLEMGVEHITVTVNAVDPEIGAKIYDYVYDNDEKLTGIQAAEFLLERQMEGIKMITSKGVLCKVNIVMIKGINDHHVEEVVKTVTEMGVFITNIMPLIPAEGTRFENIRQMNNIELKEKRDQCSKHINQMYHCRQCRADAIGQLNDDRSKEFLHIGCPARKKMA